VRPQVFAPRIPRAMASVLCAMASVGLLGFWAGLYLASRRFPSQYDWRYMTISSLLYPDRDPRGYSWAWCGVVACALGGLCWVSVLMRSHASRPGTWALALGYVCMVGCAVWPGHLLHLPRGHDLLALLAFVGICAGTVCLTYEWVERGLRPWCADAGAHASASTSAGAGGWSRAGARVCAGLVASAALLPLCLEAATQADVARAFPHLPWVGLEWRARGVPLYLSFAFWEWATCAVLSVYIVALSLAPLLHRARFT